MVFKIILGFKFGLIDCRRGDGEIEEHYNFGSEQYFLYNLGKQIFAWRCVGGLLYCSARIA